jgi:hypothetical protein
LKIILHALTTKEEGLPPLPKALQMFKNKRIVVEPKFTQISCNQKLGSSVQTRTNDFKVFSK